VVVAAAAAGVAAVVSVAAAEVGVGAVASVVAEVGVAASESTAATAADATGVPAGADTSARINRTSIAVIVTYDPNRKIRCVGQPAHLISFWVAPLMPRNEHGFFLCSMLDPISFNSMLNPPDLAIEIAKPRARTRS
jgi:hypothetical protein